MPTAIRRWCRQIVFENWQRQGYGVEVADRSGEVVALLSGTIEGASAAWIITVRVEVAVRPAVSVTT
jgi:hypothetical protein